MNHVTVIPRIRARAWQGDPEERFRAYECVGIKEALESPYRTDACILAYGKAGASYPRLGSASLAYYVLNPELAPTLNVVLFDLDTPGHVEADEAWVQKQLDRLPADERPLWSWYQTKHGMRLVGIPAQPVPLRKANAYIEYEMNRLLAYGLEIDEACKRWYRLYRAPKANGRDFPYDFAPLEAGRTLPEYPGGLDALDDQTAASMGPIGGPGSRPDVDGSKPPTKTEAQRQLGKNSPLASDIASGMFLPPVGQRHAALLKAASLSVRHTGTNNPEVPFRLLLNAALKMGKDAEELWRLCTWTVARSEGEKVALAEEREEAVERLGAALGSSDPETIRRRCILDVGKEFLVLDEFSGTYIGPLFHEHQLAGALRDHCPTLAGDLAVPGISKGKLSYELGTRVSKVVYSYTDANLGYDESERKVYVRICKHAPDVHPEYNAEVAEWLRLLAVTQDQHEYLLNWLAAYPNLDEPICALYVDGPPGVGKGMLALGLARVYSVDRAYVPYSRLFDQFNPEFRVSPLVWADEAVPKDRVRSSSSSVLRRAVGTASIEINAKHEQPSRVVGNARVLVTANNPNAFEFLEEIQEDDLHAIKQRLGYISVHATAAKQYLEKLAQEKPGCESVKEYCEPWVKGGAIARHILWLAENRKVTPNGRFLVTGWDSALFDKMLSRVGATEQIGCALAHIMLKLEKSEIVNPAVRWYKGAVYANLNELLEHWPTLTGWPPNQTPRHRALTGSLERLSPKGKKTTKRLAPVNRGSTRPRYWKLDAARIDEIASSLSMCEEGAILAIASRKHEPDYDPEWKEKIGELKLPAAPVHLDMKG